MPRRTASALPWFGCTSRAPHASRVFLLERAQDVERSVLAPIVHEYEADILRVVEETLESREVESRLFVVARNDEARARSAVPIEHGLRQSRTTCWRRSVEGGDGS